MADPLTYGDYIRDRAIVTALDLSERDVPDWPVKPPGWQPGDDWPITEHWVHDEVLFIRTHQAFEVWFAQILHELTSVVREATLLNGAGFEDPHLARRDPATAPKLGDWSHTQAVMHAYPGLTSAFDALREPGCFHVATEFPRHFGEGDDFYHALLRWQERIDRSAMTLLTTITFFDILATMPPAHFLKFRGRLQPASGFGSAQFRELEYLLGLRELHETKLQPEGGEPTATPPLWKPTAATPSDQTNQSFFAAQTAWGRERVARRARETSLRDVVYGLLNAAYLAGSRPKGPEKGLPDLRPAAIDRFFASVLQNTLDDQHRGTTRTLDAAGMKHLTTSLEGMNDSLMHRETVTAALINAMPEKELFAAFLNACLKLDGALLQWRDRHIRFVEAMIGTRVGTGGGGIRYLSGTVAHRHTYVTHAFPCLWQARSFVQ